MADNRKDDFKELLTALVKESAEIVNSPDESKMQPDELKEYRNSAMGRAENVILDRIVISEEVSELRLLGEWRVMVSKYIADQNTVQFEDRLYEFRRQIIAAAKRSASKIGF